MSIDAKRRAAAAGFVALLILSVFWPSPIVAVNHVCCNAALSIDELSFLGREAPSWDVLFWCITGLFALMLLQDASDFRPLAEEVRATRFRITPLLGSAFVVAAAVVAAAWFYADAPATALSERINSSDLEDWIRIANRFGGGMNPVMIIVFFALAGLAYARRGWIGIAIRMTIAGAAGGVI